jgi:ATP-dependent Clp protease protease subunit
MRVPDLGSLIADVQARRMALDATGSYFVTDIDAAHAEDFAKSILLMSIPRRSQRDQPITVYINSGGGSVGDGLAMMEMINRMRRRFDVRIDTVVLGYAYSMGAIVSQAGDHRSIGRFGTLMLHSTQWILSGEDERIFKDYQQLSEHYQHTVAELFARRTGYRDEAWWRRFIWSGRERFLGPDECLELGLVDEILEPANLPVGAPRPQSPKPSRGHRAAGRSALGAGHHQAKRRVGRAERDDLVVDEARLARRGHHLDVAQRGRATFARHDPDRSARIDRLAERGKPAERGGVVGGEEDQVGPGAGCRCRADGRPRRQLRQERRVVDAHHDDPGPEPHAQLVEKGRRVRPLHARIVPRGHDRGAAGHAATRFGWPAAQGRTGRRACRSRR